MEIKWLRHRGFTLVELIVVIAIIAVLAAILFPVYGRAREKSRDFSCLSNTREIGLAALLYTQDADDSLPPPAWLTQLSCYTKNAQIFTCPNDPNRKISYCMNRNVCSRRLGQSTDWSSVILFGDGYTQSETLPPTALASPTIIYNTDAVLGRPSAAGDVAYRHNGGSSACFTFCDGHAKWLIKGTLTYDMFNPL